MVVLPDIHDNTEQRLASATQWVNSLDRSVLGKFAIAPERSLVLLHAYWITSLQSQQSQHDKDSNYIIARGSEINEMFKDELEDARFTRKELLLWWRMSSDNVLMNFVNSSVDAGVIDDLMKVYFNPQYLKYYEVDIWDEAHIKRLIRYDIDPELVTSR